MPFFSLNKAIEYAKTSAKISCLQHPEDYKELEEEWLFCVEYSTEGDMFWVVEHNIETWAEFMDRAKENGLSPTTQELIDRKRGKI